MSKRVHSSMLEFERWLSASIAEAEGVVPDLLDLPARLLRQQIRLRPELRTVGGCGAWWTSPTTRSSATRRAHTS